MPTSAQQSAEFDEFYLASRRRLVLQAYALTGDLGAARGAVRDAFVAARHHWRKVSRQVDPEEWVRPRAWAMAQRRHVTRLWHREKGISPEQKAVLDALHHLPDQQRKALLLAHLAALSSADVGRELGETLVKVEDLLTEATRSYCEETGVAPGDLRESLERLAPIAEAAALPRSPVIHRSGRRRRQLRTVAGTALLVLATLLGGVFVVHGGGTATAVAGQPSRQDDHKGSGVTRAMLVDAAQVARISPGQRWKLVSTSDNTAGTGINSVCQTRRFADPDGRGTMVRKFTAAGVPQRRYLQTVEISRDDTAAKAAYRTTLGWFAGCSEARVQLLNAYRVTGLADEAQVLKLRIPADTQRTYVVGVARTGSLTVATVLETVNGRPVDVQTTVDGLGDAVRNVCESRPAGACPGVMRIAPVLPPPSGETPGTLAVADLPVVGTIDKPWVGTDPVAARVNVAATTCDKASFVRAGAPHPMTRTFLIPQQRLPRRFGITETYGALPSAAKAQALVALVRSRMAGCEKKDLGAKVSNAVTQAKGYRGSEYSLWRLDSEINDRQDTVGFWMGIVRVDNYVAQVNFTPVGRNDVDADTFQALVTRARDRLFELSGHAQ